MDYESWESLSLSFRSSHADTRDIPLSCPKSGPVGLRFANITSTNPSTGIPTLDYLGIREACYPFNSAPR